MSDLAKVSVIIPCYNREKYVREAVESVLQQTHENVELLVVNDGSTDSTSGILKSYGDRLIYLEHPGGTNQGQSASINLALSHATGDYIAILDSDDMWVTNKIEKQLSYLEKHPEIGLVYSNGWGTDENGNVLYNIYEANHEEHSNPNRVLLDCYFLVPNNALVRSEIYQKIGGFDETMRAAQDHDMAIRIAEVTKLAYIDEFLFYYRRHPDSISNKKADLRWQTGFAILEKARLRYPYPASIIRRRRAVLHFRMGQCCKEQGQYFKALKHFITAGLLDYARATRVLLGAEPISSPH